VNNINPRVYPHEYLYNRLLFARYRVEYDAFPTIYGRMIITRYSEGGRIVFARGNIVNSKFIVNPVGGWRTAFMIMLPEAVIRIGENTGMSNTVIASASSVTIGRNVAIGAGTKIFDTDFHGVHPEDRFGTRPTKPVVIEDDVFIGGNVTILKGVTVGRASVIGAGAVVAKNIPPGEIWAGNPVRFIKKQKESTA
jgi:acetyltransferase-like isoleucine patch superfamily enzyme